MSTRVELPGLRSPAASFDEPFAMLDACHERMLRSLQLLQRLCRHVQQLGAVDEQAARAAQDVLRYFDIAAPLHHQDEELHVFPALCAPDVLPELQAAVARLTQEHRSMEALWAQLRAPLAVWSQGTGQPLDAQHMEQMQQFVLLYQQHLEQEEGSIFPQARSRTDAAALQRMGMEMAARRTAPVADVSVERSPQS